MIFKALTKSTKTLILRPYILLPMLIVSIISYLLIEATAGLFERYFTDLLLYGDVISEFDPIIFIISNYPVELILLLISGIVMLFATVSAIIMIAKFCDEKGFVESINSTVMEWKRNLGLVIFGVIVLFLFFVILFAISGIFDWINNITAGFFGPIIYYIIIPIILLFLVLLFAIKLAFVIPIFAQGEKIKEAIQKSWEATNKTSLNVLVYVLILIVITFLIYQLFMFLSLNIIELEIVLLSAGEIISTTFFVLGISYYYYLR